MRILPLLMAAVLLASCDKKQAEQQQINNVEAGGSDSLQLQNQHDSTVVSPDASTGTAEPATTATTTIADNKPALNPEHGQPYHRCDIPVGAPIDSAPPAHVAPQVVQQPAPQSSSNFNTAPIAPSLNAAAPASGAKPALNPPHGEPHHRCDLQVGAPLT